MTTYSLANLPSTIRCLHQPDRSVQELTLTTTSPPAPRPNSNDHLIRVHAVAPCKGELTWAFTDSSLMHPSRVDIPCFDLSGTVITSPPSSPFPPGTPVFAHTSAFYTGNAREYTIVQTHELARKPEGLSWEEAASVSLSALTAFQALFEHGGLKWRKEEREENKGKKVLITAAAGGVGVWAVQLARIVGVGEIIAVCGTGNVEFVRELGASRVIDYRKQRLGEWVREEKGVEVDLVLDMVGGESLRGAWAVMREGGMVISVVERESESLRPQEGVADGVKGMFFILEPNGEQLGEIAELLRTGEARAVVDSVWELEQYEEAFAKVDAGHARGKVVIRIPE